MTTHGSAAKHARERKERRPDLYCPDARCLWMTGGGACPRHSGPAWTSEREAEASRRSRAEQTIQPIPEIGTGHQPRGGAAAPSSPVELVHVRHAGHYSPAHPDRGHDLLVIRVTAPTLTEAREILRASHPALASEVEYRSATLRDGVATWDLMKVLPMSPGRCEWCPPKLVFAP